jgi:hypothetical protein
MPDTLPVTAFDAMDVMRVPVVGAPDINDKV